MRLWIISWLSLWGVFFGINDSLVFSAQNNNPKDTLNLATPLKKDAVPVEIEIVKNTNVTKKQN